MKIDEFVKKFEGHDKEFWRLVKSLFCDIFRCHSTKNELRLTVDYAVGVSVDSIGGFGGRVGREIAFKGGFWGLCGGYEKRPVCGDQCEKNI